MLRLFLLEKTGQQATAFRLRIYQGDNLQTNFFSLRIAVKLRIVGKTPRVRTRRTFGFLCISEDIYRNKTNRKISCRQ